MGKRFFLFAGEGCYPEGGVGDYKGAFQTMEEAKAALKSADWAHVAEFTDDGLREVLTWQHPYYRLDGEQVRLDGSAPKEWRTPQEWENAKRAVLDAAREEAARRAARPKVNHTVLGVGIAAKMLGRRLGWTLGTCQEVLVPVDGYDPVAGTLGAFRVFKPDDDPKNLWVGTVVVGRAVQKVTTPEAATALVSTPEAQALKAELQQALEPLGAWDPATFAVWSIDTYQD